jgi:hypothetical protein
MEQEGTFQTDDGRKVPVLWWVTVEDAELFDSATFQTAPTAVPYTSTPQYHLRTLHAEDAYTLDGVSGVLDTGTEQIHGQLREQGDSLTLYRR